MASFWELPNGLNDNTNCIENISEKLPSGVQENNTMHLRTAEKALHINKKKIRTFER